MNRDLSLKDLMLIGLKEASKILITILVFALVFGSLGLFLGYRDYTNSEQKKLLHTAFLQKEVVYENEIYGLEQEIELLEIRQLDLNEYTNKSLYFKMDSYHKAVKEIVFYVETDYQVMPNMVFQNPDRTDKIVSGYITAYKSNDLYIKLCDILGSNLDKKYIAEIISVSQEGDNAAVKISASHSDIKVAEKLADTIYEYLQNKVADAFGEHRILLVGESTFAEIDSKLNELQIANTAELNDIIRTLKTKQSELEIKKAEEPKEDIPSLRGAVKKALLFACMGGIIGGVIIVLWIIFAYLLNNRIKDESDLKLRYNLEILGVLSSFNKRKRKYLFNKLISYIEGQRNTLEDLDDCLAFIASNIRLVTMNTDISKILLLGAKNEAINGLETELKAGEIKDIEFLYAGNLLMDSVSLDNLFNSDAVILICTLGITYLSQLDEEILKIEKSGKKILGLILQ